MHNVQDDVENLARALESEEEDRSSVPAQAQEPAPPPTKLIPDCLNNTKLRVVVPQMVYKEAERIHTSKVRRNVVEDDRERTFRCIPHRLRVRRRRLKDSIFLLRGANLKKRAQNGALDEVFDRNIDRWTQR